MTVIGELERMLNEAVVAYFQLLYQHSPGRSEGDHEDTQSTWLSPERDWKPGPLENVTGVLTNRS
jgi:hypothetical protein